MTLKDTTEILERTDSKGKKVNGGMHRQPAYRRGKEMLEGHGFKGPRLYHIVIMDRYVEGPPNGARFLKSVKAVCKALHDQGIRYRWRSALELDEEKGLHLHVFFLVENLPSTNPRAVSPCSIFTSNSNNQKPKRRPKWKDGTVGEKPYRTLGDIMRRNMLGFHIAQPQAQIHRNAQGERKNYATLANPAKREDCIQWISYIYKARSKPTHIRGIYSGSRDSKAGNDHHEHDDNNQ